MPKYRASRPRKKYPKKRRALFIRRWIIQFSVIGLCIFFAYCLILDFRVRKEFESRYWLTSARIYAREFAFYPNQRYGIDLLLSRLRDSGYQAVRKLSGHGQFAVQPPGVVDIFMREFHFGDRIEPARKIRVVISQQHIDRIIDLDSGERLQVAYLPPPLIGKIYPFHDEDRILVKFDEIPPGLTQALISVEDRDFFEHVGIDPKGILRSFYANLLSGRLKQGGSTLTQQLVRNMFLSQERTFSRKINEILMALMLEYHYSKEHILEAYVNDVYLGQNGKYSVHGFGTAAEFYFARPLRELNLAQVALLTGMVKGASYYNPRRHPQRALQRRNLVLKLMRRQGFIDTAESDRLSAKPLQLARKSGWSSAKYPAYLDLVRRHLKRDYNVADLHKRGLHILTTLDIDKQDVMEKVIDVELQKLDREKGFKSGILQTAVLIIDQHSGELIALAGGREKAKSTFNRALDARRAIGSLVKPAVYMMALDRPDRYHVLSALEDSRIALRQRNGKERWVPENHDKKIHGRVPLIRSLANSYNLATVRLGMTLGVDNVVKTLENLSVSGAIPELPAILLGALELSPYEVTQIYQSIASGGLQIPLRTIRAVLDREQRLIPRNEMPMRRVIKPETALLTQFLLMEAVRSGTAKALAQQLPSLMPIAGKTGTTNGLRDSWFAGFGDDMLAVVWIGRNDNKSVKLGGAGGAMRLWSSIMKQLKPSPLKLGEIENIEWQSYSDMSNPPRSCKDRKAYPFIHSHLPGPIACF